MNNYVVIGIIHSFFFRENLPSSNAEYIRSLSWIKKVEDINPSSNHLVRKGYILADGHTFLCRCICLTERVKARRQVVMVHIPAVKAECSGVGTKEDDSKKPGPPPILYSIYYRRESITVRGQSYVSRLPKYWPLTPPPLSARRVCPSPWTKAGGYTLAGRSGG